jgi:hypothetical protein
MSRERAILSGALALFLALSLYQLNLPAPHYDEAVEALPAVQLLQGRPVLAFRGAGVSFLGRFFPLMTQDYIGALNTYLALPFLATLGVNVFSLRLMPVLVGLVTILLLSGFARDLYGWRASLIAALLLAVSPSFVFWNRQGIFVTSLTAPIALGTAWCWLRWRRMGRLRHACLGAFLLGLGLYAKFLFLWFVGAMAISALLLLFTAKSPARPACTCGAGTGGLRQRAREVIYFPLRSWRPPCLYPTCTRPVPEAQRRVRVSAAEGEHSGGWLITVLFCFLLGLAPLLTYNLQTGGTIAAITGNLATSYYGVNNLAFLHNLRTRLEQFVTFLNGGHFWYLGGIFSDDLLPAALLLSLIALLFFDFRGERGQLRRDLFPFLVMGTVVVESCATVSSLWVTHYAILAPWPALGIAVGIERAWRWWEGVMRRSSTGWASKGPGGLLIGALVVVLLIGEVWTDIRYHRVLTASGGLSAHSDASYALAEYLDRQGYAAPLALDWGISAQVEFLTAGRVRPIEVFGYGWEVDPAFAERLAPFLASPDSVYIFHSQRETVFPRRDAFDHLVRQEGRVTHTEKVVTQRDGQALYLVMRTQGR